jgi:hypothetical protein
MKVLFKTTLLLQAALLLWNTGCAERERAIIEPNAILTIEEASEDVMAQPDTGVSDATDAASDLPDNSPDTVTEDGMIREVSQDVSRDHADLEEDIPTTEDIPPERDIPPARDTTEDRTVIGPGALCPPTASGSGIGQVPNNARVFACDGVEMHSLYELCSLDASWIFFYAEWSEGSLQFLRQGNHQAVLDAVDSDSFEAWIVVTENGDGLATDEAHCASVEETYEGTAHVYMDHTGALQSALDASPNDENVIMDRGNIITYSTMFASDEDLLSAIEEALATD